MLEKGYEVYNITSPLPTNSIESYLGNTNPGLVLISVTLEENINSTIRLLQEIRKSLQISVIVGGNAIKSASKSQIQLLEKYDKVYLDLDNLTDIITNVNVVLSKK